jgi:heptose II phosphotransferase
LDFRNSTKDQEECGRIQVDSWTLLSALDDESARAFLSAHLKGQLRREDAFRDNRRTLSVQVHFEGESLLLKVPRARNGRYWERFLTVFRGSDAMRSFRQLQLMPSLGLEAPQPVIVGENRRKGFVADSFLSYRFVEARKADRQDAPRILAALQKLHRQGYQRTDAQLANFLIRDDGRVVFIDFRLKKPLILSELRKAKELDRFFRSCPEARADYTGPGASSAWLIIARYLSEFEFAMRAFKRRLRRNARKN